MPLSAPWAWSVRWKRWIGCEAYSNLKAAGGSAVPARRTGMALAAAICRRDADQAEKCSRIVEGSAVEEIRGSRNTSVVCNIQESPAAGQLGPKAFP
jgi:hypothetical protein